MEKAEAENGRLPGIAIRAKFCVESDETADCALFCRCDDGQDYAIKDRSKTEALPHCEWFCTRLGERVGLASPPCAVVDVQGVNCFGSRWETGHEPEQWWVRAKSGEIDFSLLAPTISRILAFDLFVHNGDRHLKNFLIRQQKMGHAILAFDYSRAWLWNGFPPPQLPLNSASMTIQAFRYLNNMFPNFLSISDVKYVTSALRQFPVSGVEGIFSEHPDEWLTNSQKNEILTWWDSSSRVARIDQIEEGVTDGSFL